MASIARGQPSDCTNPILDVFFRQGTGLVDVAMLEFQIFEKVSAPLAPVQVYPLVIGTRETVNLSPCPTGQKLSTGHYFALWTPPLTELIGTHELHWFFKRTLSSPEQLFVEEFEVLPEVSAFATDGYASIADVRDEGVTTTMASDARVAKLIELASARIDRFTGRFFNPRSQVLHLNGRDARAILLNDPIIAVSEVRLVAPLAEDPTGDIVDLDTLKVFNRHLTEGLLNPDDRDNPHLEFLHGSDTFGPAVEDDVNSFAPLIFPRGVQNVIITGIFGYTDPDGTPMGRTPLLIQRACVLMVIDTLAPAGSAQYARSQGGGMIKREKTMDQEYELFNRQDGGSAASWLTGNPEVDSVLDQFRRVAGVGAA
jgi:hypothetical protein